MADDAVWRLGTWDGNRRRQHEEFRALPLREKIAVIEQLAEVTALFAARWRRGRMAARARAGG